MAIIAMGCCAGLSAQTVIKVGASQGAKQTTIQLAYDSIVPATLAGAYVLELQADYDPTTEIYPIAFKAKTGASTTNNITIKPATGVKKVISTPDQTKMFTGIAVPPTSTTLTLPSVEGITTSMYVVGNGITTITKVSAVDPATNTLTLATATPATPQVPAITSQTIYVGPSYGSYTANSPGASGTKTMVFYGAKYITIDGVSRTDANTGLTIQNPNVISAQTLYFFGGASNITVRECFIKGANITSSFKGNNPSDGNNATIWFEGAGFNNTIENNDICDIDGKPMPISFFCFLNTTTAPEELTTINNNRIYNLNPNVSSTTGNVGFFNFPSSSSPNCVVTNNRLYWTKPLESSYKDFYVFGFGGSSAGAANRVENNVVGGTDADNNGVVNIDFNKATFSVYNINDNTTFKNNVVKNLNITCNTAATVMGVRVTANQPAKAPADINAWTGNTVKDITCNFKAGGSSLIGMVINSNAAHPARNISNNIISGLTASNTTAGSQNTIRGIQIAGTATPLGLWNYTNNKIFNLTAGDANSTAANTIIGLDVTASTGTVERNLIYNLLPITAPTTTTGVVYGLRTTGSTIQQNGTTTGAIIKNNIIRLGQNVTNDLSIVGFYQAAATTAGDACKIYNNSIYIGGQSPASAIKPTYAFFHTGVSQALDIQNNIFANARGLGSIEPTSAEAHYAMAVPTGLNISKCNHNIYMFTKYFGNVESVNAPDLATWASNNSSDANSLVADPKFVDATATAPDFNILATSPAKGAGVDLSSFVPVDFNGFVRSTLDIGALAYGSVASGVVSADENVLSIYSDNNAIVINNLQGNTAQIYSISGQLVKTAFIYSNKESVTLKSGFYIVKVGSQKGKVLVK